MLHLVPDVVQNRVGNIADEPIALRMPGGKQMFVWIGGFRHHPRHLRGFRYHVKGIRGFRYPTARTTGTRHCRNGAKAEGGGCERGDLGELCAVYARMESRTGWPTLRRG